MRLSCLPVSLFSEIRAGRISVRDWSEAAATLPLDAFDISTLFVPDRTPTGLAALKKELGAGGLPLGMVATYPDFTVSDPLHYEWELKRALSDISVAAELGAAYVRITAGQYNPGLPEETQLERVLAAFSVCAEAAARWSVQLVWENHSKPGAWDRPDYNFDAGRLIRMYERLRGGPIGMNYDTANAAALGFPPTFYERCVESVQTIHLNDLASVSPLRFSGVGDGIVPLSETLSIAARCGFHGQVSVEEAAMQGMEGVRKYVLAARALLDGQKA